MKYRANQSPTRMVPIQPSFPRCRSSLRGVTSQLPPVPTLCPPTSPTFRPSLTSDGTSKSFLPSFLPFFISFSLSWIVSHGSFVQVLSTSVPYFSLALRSERVRLINRIISVDQLIKRQSVSLVEKQRKLIRQFKAGS